MRRCVVVSSPGRGALHWSHAAAAGLATALQSRGAPVDWFAAVRPGQQPTPVDPGLLPQLFPLPAAPPLARVAAAHVHLAIETAMTRALRAAPAAAVVHVGLGAGGSPNVGWLAERLGSPVFAVVRAAEVVCHRGDLIDAAGAPCTSFLDAERCRRCCATAPWPAPRVVDLHNRADLLAASLAAATVVFVRDAADAPLLTAFGVPARTVAVAVDADAIAERVLA